MVCGGVPVIFCGVGCIFELSAMVDGMGYEIERQLVVNDATTMMVDDGFM